MEITEVRIQILTGGRDDKLKAFATFTIDREFVVRDIKIIEGHNGLFVAMPSRKVTERCPSCGTKNPVRSNYCSDCGKKCVAEPQPSENEGRKKFHIDVAHPVSQTCREKIHAAIIEAYESSSKAEEGAGVAPPVKATD